MTREEGLELIADHPSGDAERNRMGTQWILGETWFNLWYSYLDAVSEATQNAREPKHFAMAEFALTPYRIRQVQNRKAYLGAGTVPSMLEPFVAWAKKYPETLRQLKPQSDDGVALLEAARRVSGFDAEEREEAARVLDPSQPQLDDLPDLLRERFFDAAGFSPEQLNLLREMHRRRLDVGLPLKVTQAWDLQDQSAALGKGIVAGHFLGQQLHPVPDDLRIRSLALIPLGWIAITEDYGIFLEPDKPQLRAHFDWEIVKTIDSACKLEVTNVDSVLIHLKDGRVLDHRGQEIAQNPRQIAGIAGYGYFVVTKQGRLEWVPLNEPDEALVVDQTVFEEWLAEMQAGLIRFVSVATSDKRRLGAIGDNGVLVSDTNANLHAFPFSVSQKNLRIPSQSETEPDQFQSTPTIEFQHALDTLPGAEGDYFRLDNEVYYIFPDGDLATFSGPYIGTYLRRKGSYHRGKPQDYTHLGTSYYQRLGRRPPVESLLPSKINFSGGSRAWFSESRRPQGGRDGMVTEESKAAKAEIMRKIDSQKDLKYFCAMNYTVRFETPWIRLLAAGAIY